MPCELEHDAAVFAQQRFDASLIRPFA